MGEENTQPYSTPCDSSTNACAIGMAKDIVASPSKGTKMNEKSIYQCPTTSSPCPISTHPPTKTTGPTISPCHACVWGKEAIFTGKRQLSRPQQGQKEIHPRSMQCISVPCTSSQRRTALSTKLTCLPNGEPNRENDELCKQFLDYMAMQ